MRFDSVNLFALGFKDGKLWSRLVQVFRTQQKLNHGTSYIPFNKFEMRMDYPSSRLGSFTLGDQTANSTIIHFDRFDKNSESDLSLTLLGIAANATLLKDYPATTDNCISTRELEKEEAIFDFPEVRNIFAHQFIGEMVLS